MLFTSLGKMLALTGFDQVDTLLTQPLLVIAGSEAGSLWHSQELYTKARAEKKEVFLTIRDERSAAFVVVRDRRLGVARLLLGEQFRAEEPGGLTGVVVMPNGAASACSDSTHPSRPNFDAA